MSLEIEQLIKDCQENANKHHWKITWNTADYISNLKNYKSLTVGDALALCHSELSEALESYRDDDKKHFSEEIADTFIRLFHLCGDLNLDIEAAIHKKMAKNISRPINHGGGNIEDIRNYFQKLYQQNHHYLINIIRDNNK